MRLGLEIGEEFAGYRIERLIGRGGMGVVYLAEHLRLGRKDALKILAPQFGDESFTERFLRESRLAAALDHPNIIPVYHAGEVDGTAYIAMRFVDGGDLGALLEAQGPLSPEEALPIIEQVASALDAAHERGLIHRDVKPANILISEADKRVYLTDFGIAKSRTTRGLTRTGSFLGTIDYCPPEQIEGKELDGRADVYALGAVLFQALTGQPPFAKDTDVAVMHAHLIEPPPAVTTLRPDLPTAIDGVVVTAMAKYPEVRYSSAGQLAHALREAVAGDVRAAAAAPKEPSAPKDRGKTLVGRLVSTVRAPRPVTPPTTPVVTAPRRSRRTVWVAAAVLACAAAGITIALLSLRGGHGRAAGGTTPPATTRPAATTTAPTTTTGASSRLEPIPTSDRFDWPNATLLAQLPRLRGMVIAGASCCRGNRNNVAWLSLVTKRNPREVWADVRERWVPLLAGASYVLEPTEVTTDEFEGPAVAFCLVPNVRCSLWRRARQRYRLDLGANKTRVTDTAQIMVRSIRADERWVEDARADGEQLATLRHPDDGTVKLWQPTYTEVEISVGGPEAEALPTDAHEREINLVELKQNLGGEIPPTYSPQNGRCFGPYLRSNGKRSDLYLGPGQDYYDDFLECGDEGGRRPGPFSATGRFTFPRVSPLPPAGSSVVRFEATQAGIDWSSDEQAHPGLSVSWSILYYGEPMTCRSGNTAYPQSSIELRCAVSAQRGTVYEADTRALVIRQIAQSVTGNGDLWAGLYHPRLFLRVRD